MNPEAVKRPGKVKGNPLTIMAAMLGILAADVGTVRSAIPPHSAPAHSRLEPGFPNLRELKERHSKNVVDESVEMVEAIIAIRKRFIREYEKVQPRLNQFISRVPGKNLDVRSDDFQKAVHEELADLNRAPDAEIIQALAGIILKSADALQDFVMILDFSEQSLTGPVYDGPSQLLDKFVHEEESRVDARKAIKEAHEIFESKARDLSDAFYRVRLLTLRRLQPPQPAKPEPKER